MDKIIQKLKDEGIIDAIQDTINTTSTICKNANVDRTESIKAMLSFSIVRNEELSFMVVDWAIGQIEKELNLKPQDNKVNDEMVDILIDMLRKAKGE